MRVADYRSQVVDTAVNSEASQACARASKDIFLKELALPGGTLVKSFGVSLAVPCEISRVCRVALGDASIGLRVSVHGHVEDNTAYDYGEVGTWLEAIRVTEDSNWPSDDDNVLATWCVSKSEGMVDRIEAAQDVQQDIKALTTWIEQAATDARTAWRAGEFAALLSKSLAA